MKSPAFQWYPKDYLSDMHVMLMTMEQEGCYIRLLSICWEQGSIPSDENELSALCKGSSTEAIKVVKRRFEIHPEDSTRMIHLRLELERKKQKIWSKKCSEAGKKSHEIRASKLKSKDCKSENSSTNLDTVVEPTHELNSNQLPALQFASASSSSSAEKEKYKKEKVGINQKPEIKELYEYGEAIKLPMDECDAFLNHFDANGWRVGKALAPMRDWKAALRTWAGNKKKWGNSNEPDLSGRYR